jgi:hypothetical protein
LCYLANDWYLELGLVVVVVSHHIQPQRCLWRICRRRTAGTLPDDTARIAAAEAAAAHAAETAREAAAAAQAAAAAAEALRAEMQPQPRHQPWPPERHRGQHGRSPVV